jgi:Holliday junction resolvase
MSNPSKQKGTAAETALLRWLHANGHPDAVRNPPSGAKDVGDLTVGVIDVCEGQYAVTIEVKNRRDLAAAIRDGLNELDTEMHNAGTTNGVLVVKPRGKGNPGDWYAIRRLHNDPQIGAHT